MTNYGNVPSMMLSMLFTWRHLHFVGDGKFTILTAEIDAAKKALRKAGCTDIRVVVKPSRRDDEYMIEFKVPTDVLTPPPMALE